MIIPTPHGNAPTAPTVKASNTHVQLGMSVPPTIRLVNRLRSQLAALVNRFPPLAMYNELQAARSLAAAYEATAERRARQRRFQHGQKDGQR
jgi:hypothetical protein